MSQNVIAQYFVWHFYDVPKELGKAWKNYLRSYLSFFSIVALVRTLFAPWHGYQWSYGRGFSFSRYAETLVSNTFARVLGAIIRIFLIIFGVIFEAIIFFLGAIVFFGWILLPAIIVIFFVYGIKFLF
ncbi:hypothetical protein KJ591_01160 [Patescibacteria group bacterium]|nr:hypothetical protein [Patescibacteria group bacterium]MBU4022953.1 hypothetical protein [Patescibacteria group bacterium]MBU4162096.1 hypothetical protein [Patescibacteria group bacterium]